MTSQVSDSFRFSFEENTKYFSRAIKSATECRIINYVNLRYKIDLQNNAKSLLIKRQAVELFYAGCTSFADRRHLV
jgi:hypothetical protein